MWPAVSAVHATVPGRNAPWHSLDRVDGRPLVPVGAKKPTYRPRDPRNTPLYRLLLDHLETFLAVYEDRYEHRFGPLGTHVERQIQAYRECGLFSAGCARVRCPDCGHEFLLPFSCKVRFLCPSCHQRKATLWAEWLVDEVLADVPHRQWVFTIPKRIRPFFRHNPALLGQLCRLTAKVLTDFFHEALGCEDLKPGIVSVLQTFNSDLSANPHPHLIATDGCLGPDGTFVRISIHRGHDLSLIEEHFRREVLALLRARDLLTEDDVENMLSWPHSGFAVHNDVKILPGDRDGLMDLSKYLARPPIALSRMRYGGTNDPLVYIRLKRPHWRTGRREISFEPLEFLARLVQHIPPLNFKAWRQYGAYSAVVRARWRREAEADDVADSEAQPPPPSPGRKRCSSAWAALLSRTWGFDPLECPDCGGRLEIVTAIHDADSLERITHHYGLDTGIPELQPARAPPWLQGEWEFDVVPPAEFDAVDPPIDDEAYFVDPPGDDGLPVIELT